MRQSSLVRRPSGSCPISVNFPLWQQKKCLVYVSTVPFFDNISIFSHYFCTGLSEFFFFCLVWLHNSPEIFLFDIFNWNHCVTAILGAKFLLCSTFSAGKWIFRISRFSDLKTLCYWIWKEVTGKLWVLKWQGKVWFRLITFNTTIFPTVS